MLTVPEVGELRPMRSCMNPVTISFRQRLIQNRGGLGNLYHVERVDDPVGRPRRAADSLPRMDLAFLICSSVRGILESLRRVGATLRSLLRSCPQLLPQMSTSALGPC